MELPAGEQGVRRSAARRDVYRRVGVGVLGVVGIVALVSLLPVKQWMIALAERIRGAGAGGALLFVVVYVAAEVALVPGSLLTMAAGFAYGPVRGLLIASPASVIAATVAFLLSRTALRSWIQRKIANSPKTRALDRAIGRNSFKLILLLRLSPLIPYNVLNYALGLSDVPIGRFIVASSLGMLPGTWLYVYLGSLASSAAGLTTAGRAAAPARITLTIVGLIATAIAVLFITRTARRMLDEELKRAPS